MSEIKVNSIKGVSASAAAISVHNSDGTCTLASGSKLNNCTTDGTTNLTIADGNLVFSTNGHGVDFSAASGSNAGASSSILDDYEEGTFTPQFAGVGGGPSSISFGTTNGGSYVKVGNLVYVAGKSDITASSGGSQHWLITNMPFVNKSGTKQFNSIGHLALENFTVPDNVIDLVATMEQGINNMIFSGTRKDNTLTNGISHGADQVYSVTFAICYRTD
tara:strand:- start:275 stop:931 length:657 start_codon:yes stop_codon:yes gene_type:complete